MALRRDFEVVMRRVVALVALVAAMVLPARVEAATLTYTVACGTAGGTLRIFLEIPTGGGGNSFIPAGSALNDATGTRLIRYALIRASDEAGASLPATTRPTGYTTTETTPSGGALTWNRWFALTTLGDSMISFDCPAGESRYFAWRDETNPVLYMVEPYPMEGWTDAVIGFAGLASGLMIAWAITRAV